MADSMDEALQELVGSETFPNVTSIERNDDFTYFAVTTTNAEPDINESFGVIAFYLYGGMYAAFEGEEVEDIVVEYFNADSGEVIMTGSYAEYMQAQ